VPALREAFDALKACGFGDYEAKAYCALLAESPANGYQVARASGVPRAKVYEALERLSARGAVVEVELQPSGPGPAGRHYAPIDFDRVLEDIEDGTRSACGRARRALERYRRSPRTVEVIWRVTSEEDLIARGRALAEGAAEVLHVAVWGPEFEALRPQLAGALQRGVSLALVLYEPHPGLEGLRDLGAGAVQHSRSKTEAVPLMGRQFILVADRQKCITGSIFSQGAVEGVYSLNKGLVINAVDLVNHEIYVERILKEVGRPVWRKFGRFLGKLDAFDAPKG
jgi:sugar-specific transcriptional regulator TrmB